MSIKIKKRNENSNNYDLISTKRLSMCEYSLRKYECDLDYYFIKQNNI